MRRPLLIQSDSLIPSSNGHALRPRFLWLTAIKTDAELGPKSGMDLDGCVYVVEDPVPILLGLPLLRQHVDLVVGPLFTALHQIRD